MTLHAWSAVETAWISGLLEGEGSFTASQNNRPPSPRTPRVCVAMSDEDTIQRVADLFGGKRVLNKPTRATDLGNPRRPQWQVQVYGAEAIEVMRRVLPWMSARRTERINEITAEWYSARPHLEARNVDVA